MPKHTPEQLAAKRRLAHNKNRVREAMMAGNLKKARSIAAAEGFNLQDARLAPIYNHPSEPFFAVLDDLDGTEVIVTAPVPDPTAMTAPTVVAEPMENGWPVECGAEIWGPCPNTRLVVVRLDDGRKVSLEKTRGLPYRSQDRVRIRLFKSLGDPLYVELPRATTTF